MKGGRADCRESPPGSRATRARTHAQAHARTHARTLACTGTHKNTQAHVHTHKHARTYMQAHTHADTHSHTRTHTHAPIHTLTRSLSHTHTHSLASGLAPTPPGGHRAPRPCRDRASPRRSRPPPPFAPSHPEHRRWGGRGTPTCGVGHGRAWGQPRRTHRIQHFQLVHRKRMSLWKACLKSSFDIV